MRKLQLLLFIFTLLTNNINAQDNLSLSDIINIAGKQRMLGQRMAKNKLFIEAKENKEQAKKELQETIIAFNSGLYKLKEFAPKDDAIQYKIAIQENAYKTYKELIEDNSKKSTKEIIGTNTLFLAICDDLVTALVKYANNNTQQASDKNRKYVLGNIAKATGTSGKLRYLTQRLTLYFAINEFDFEAINPNEIDAIIKKMDKNLTNLTTLEFNTLTIDDSLSEVQYQWAQIKKSLYNNDEIDLNSNNINAIKLDELCNIILIRANTTTKMYADLGKSYLSTKNKEFLFKSNNFICKN